MVVLLVQSWGVMTAVLLVALGVVVVAQATTRRLRGLRATSAPGPEQVAVAGPPELVASLR